jgi:hypothetical protein
MHKHCPRRSSVSKSRAILVRPEKSAGKKRSDETAEKHGKGSSLSGKAKRKAAERAGKKGKTDKKPNKSESPKASAAIKKLMKRFTGARPSDVSDKVFVATSPVHGKGLFAAKKIKANTVLGRLHGMPTFDDGIYVLWITDELGLELTNDFKYINHDSDANAAYSDIDVTVLRDVEPGEELLHDYGW